MLNEVAAQAVRLGRLAKPFHWLHWLCSAKYLEAHRTVDAYIGRFVDEAIELRRQLPEASRSGMLNDPGNGTVLYSLALKTQDRRAMHAHILNVLLAGRDTTATLLSNVTWSLGKKPECYAKIRAEVAELNGELPTWESLSKLQYLDWCIKECKLLRLPIEGLELTISSASLTPSHSHEL